MVIAATGQKFGYLGISGGMKDRVGINEKPSMAETAVPSGCVDESRS